MIEQEAVVVDCRGDLAEIEALRRSGCTACGAKSACGTSMLDRVLGRRPIRMLLDNRIGARPGDRVVVGVPEDALLRAAVQAYIAPLAGLIGGAIAGQELATTLFPELITGFGVLGATAGFAVALHWLRRASRRRGTDERFRPVLLRRAAPEPVVVEFP